MKEIYSTTNSTELDAITEESLLQTINDSQYNNPGIVTAMKCAPNVLIYLQRYFANKEAEEVAQGIVKNPHAFQIDTFRGIKVIVDDNMEPGTWKFEYASSTQAIQDTGGADDK